jgi:hypothetical protein
MYMLDAVASSNVARILDCSDPEAKKDLVRCLVEQLFSTSRMRAMPSYTSIENASARGVFSFLSVIFPMIISIIGSITGSMLS